MKNPKILILAFAASFLLAGIFGNDDAARKDSLTQYSTIDALLTGIYDGELTIGDLKQHGDFGLGTVNSLDGEMIALDGTFYKVTSDGQVKKLGNGIKTPFAAVTFFKADRKADLHSGIDFDSLKTEIDRMLLTKNIFYAIKISGVFQKIRTRSVPKQSKPYKPLQEVVATQSVFDFEQVKGTIVGFRCPPYVNGINVPGYHLHFLTEDGKAGGHVLELTVGKALLEIDDTARFSLILPQSGPFYDADLTADKQEQLKQVEN